MQQVRNVAGTAFVVAEFRAEENEAAEPLYRDLVVKLFLNEATRAAAERVDSAFPLMKEMVKIRTKYFDEMLERQILAGCRQIVVLGAGLDTRAVRKAAPDLKYFEVDDGATLAMKQARMKRHGIDANVTFIAGNYVTDGLMPLLKQNGLDPMLSTYIIWEGNSMYLPAEDGMAVMGHLKGGLRTFCLSFDYLAPSIIGKTTGELGLTRMNENFARMGAEWVTGFDDIYQLARDANLRVVEGFSTGELYRLYRPAAPTQPVFGPYYSVCTLASL